MRRCAGLVASLLAVLAAWLGFTLTAGGATPRSGLYGRVTQGPTLPICTASAPCERPVAVGLVFSRNGRETARVRTRADGRFRVALPAGVYTVRTVPALRPGGAVSPRIVRVRPGGWEHVSFRIDTGIR